MRNLFTLAAVVACWSWASVLPSDEIHTTIGEPLSCTVLQEDPARVTVLFGASVLSFSRAEIHEIVRSDETLSAEPAATASGLPAYGEVIRRLARQPWATGLRQIPATVIDVGRCGTCPTSRSGWQRIVKSMYTATQTARRVWKSACRAGISTMTRPSHACLEFMASLLPALKTDLLAMNREKSRLEKGPLTLEFTPPTDDDAYNAWWISVYNTSALGRSRATAAELAEVTEAHRTYLAKHPPAKAAPKDPTPVVEPYAVDQTWAPTISATLGPWFACRGCTSAATRAWAGCTSTLTHT